MAIPERGSGRFRQPVGLGHACARRGRLRRPGVGPRRRAPLLQRSRHLSERQLQRELPGQRLVPKPFQARSRARGQKDFSRVPRRGDRRGGLRERKVQAGQHGGAPAGPGDACGRLPAFCPRRDRRRPSGRGKRHRGAGRQHQRETGLQPRQDTAAFRGHELLQAAGIRHENRLRHGLRRDPGPGGALRDEPGARAVEFLLTAATMGNLRGNRVGLGRDRKNPRIQTNVKNEGTGPSEVTLATRILGASGRVLATLPRETRTLKRRAKPASSTRRPTWRGPNSGGRTTARTGSPISIAW